MRTAKNMPIFIIILAFMTMSIVSCAIPTSCGQTKKSAKKAAKLRHKDKY